ncbi:YncE family protein [Thermophagus sp. OGC60D27]|uniref:YncE family protein n=1 Tax=Thermophagus sp. OGC60D27 TaxID=3458415 RepID=UPI004038344F
MKRLEFFSRKRSIQNILKIFGLSLVVMLASCEDDDNNSDVIDKGDFTNGVFVLNQGQYGAANASVSFIGEDTIMGDLFTERNNTAVLGDVLQDMVSVGNLSFLVLNASNSLMVVDNTNFEYVYEIENGIDNPRYAVVYDGLVYVSQWGNDGQIVVIDPQQLAVINTIDVSAGPEGMAVINDELWVANCGGYGANDIVSVIDFSDYSVKETIKVHDCPQDVVEDVNGDAWVLSAGYNEYDWETWALISSTPGALHRIDAGSYQVEETFEADESVYGKPTRMAMAADGESIYFGGGYGFSGIWEVAVEATELPTTKFADVAVNGMSVDPATGNLYVGIAPSYTDAGSVDVYDVNGEIVDTYSENIGIGPCNFIFVND